MNDLDQIAEEAAKQLIGREGVSSRYYQEYNQAIIKSAIEKAVADIVAQYDELKAIANARFCGHCDIGDSDAECTCGNYDLRPSRAAHRVEKDAAGASDDNCRKCGRPLGWFEPGLCEDCRAAQASKPKPLERCSSNPHYEAHFGDEPATTAHASKQP